MCKLVKKKRWNKSSVLCYVLLCFGSWSRRALCQCLRYCGNSKEDVEKCKQRDLLEQLLKEMTGEFPALSQVFVEERDIYLTHSLKMASRPREYPDRPEGKIFFF